MSLDTSQALLDRIAAALAPVGGVRAVVLGGSRGRGTHDAASDYDIGLYYDGELDIAALERVARDLNDTGAARSHQATAPASSLVTPIGGWGAWVNGGGWLTVDGAPVDILYRDAARVTRVIDDVREGHFECAYHYGHPHAFVSTIYAGEIATCRVLHDPSGFAAAAKARLEPYPDALRTATIARFSDEARFFLAIAQKAAERGDVVYVAGCAFRAASCLLQVIFAINRQWLLNEKGALALAANFPLAPMDLRTRLESAVSHLDGSARELTRALDTIAALVGETVQPA
jgi:hypothetical protein